MLVLIEIPFALLFVPYFSFNSLVHPTAHLPLISHRFLLTTSTIPYHQDPSIILYLDFLFFQYSIIFPSHFLLSFFVSSLFLCAPLFSNLVPLVLMSLCFLFEEFRILPFHRVTFSFLISFTLSFPRPFIWFGSSRWYLSIFVPSISDPLLVSATSFQQNPPPFSCTHMSFLLE